MRRPSRRALLAALPLAALARPVRATAPDAPPYPATPVMLVAPFSAGGAADGAARLLARHAARHLPNPDAAITVENRVGASGALGTLAVARARPDGRTLLLARVGPAAILPAIDPRTPYGWAEFTMLGLLDEAPFAVAVRDDAPWRTLGALVAALRDKPGTLRFATTGPATLLDLGMRHLFAAAGLPFDAGEALPFGGGAEAMAALADGRVHMVGASLPDLQPALVRGGLRLLVVGAAQRLALLPEVPTAAEAEMPALLQVSGWSALYAPGNFADAPRRAWLGALAALADDAGWLAGVRAAGSVPRLLGPAETRSFVAAQVGLYQDLGKRLGLI